ncbi:MAG: rhomboid family intramembrane serine protease [Sandaracinaceae bacterium]
MDERPQTTPRPVVLHPEMRRLAYAAVMLTVDDPQLAAAAPDLIAVLDLAGKRGAIVVELGDRDEELEARLKKLLSVWRVAATSIVVLGDETRGRALIDAAKPTVPRGRLYVHGVLDGARWDEERSGPLGEKLDAVQSADAELDWATFDARVARSAGRSKQQQAFTTRTQSRQPIATYALLAVNLAFFAAEVALAGGVDANVRLLTRMGGIAPDLVRDGEVWRLVSGTFLHSGVMHVAFNMLVLVILGRFVERLIGSARFLVLYTACALAGSIASTMFVNASVSVGASGALWGILAAQAVFAFAPGFLPDAMVPGAKRAAITNLGLNVLASFRPHVDWAAHAGGGIVGALLLYFVLARGVPRGEAIATEDPTSTGGLRIAAGICACVLAAGAIAGPLLGGALTSMPAAPTYERVTLEAAGASFEIPSGLGAGEVRELGEGARETDFGSVMEDPIVLTIATLPTGPIPPEQVDAEVSALFEALAHPPEHASVEVSPRRFEDAPIPSVGVTYLYESELRHDVSIVFTDDGAARVETLYWPDARGYARGVARHVAESYERTDR